MRKRKLLSILALLCLTASSAWAQENEGWLSGVANGDFSGDDVSSFCKKEYPSTDVVPVVIDANAGKDGTPGIVVKSGDDTANPDAQIWDTQFWIVLSEEMPAGSTIRVQFDYKASKAAKGSTEFHADPASYLTWQAIGDVNFTTEWKTFSGEFTVPNDADGMKSIAFKLQEEKSATDYYFDNISVSYKKTQWTNIIANSDMEGTDVSCFYVHEQGKKGIFLARITEGIGVDGSRAIKVQSSDDESNSWDTQFFFRLPYVLPKGTMYRLSFDYKSDKAGVRVSNDEDYSFGFQLANEPNQYIWWTLGGWPAPSIETDESNVNKWQHYKKVFAVPTECDGVSKADDNDWLRQFRTIYANLSANKVATEFIFDNVKVEILSDVVSTLTAEPVTDPELMIPYLVGDEVAVGKLKAAIETYYAVASPTDDDKATLKAAIDQYYADNADIEKDETAKVKTDGWKKFDGNTADLAPDWAAPAVTTYDKRSAQPAEVYEGSKEGVDRTGNIIYQDITGLTNGQYKVGFYGTAYYTNGRGFDSTMEDGSTDVAYVFANEQKKFITARVGTSFSEYNLLQFDVEVTDGNIKLGLGKERGGSNWHTMQIYQLTWFATAKQAYAAYQTELAALLTEAKALAADEYKTEGKDDFNTAIATAEEATTTKADWYNNAEIAKIIADLKTAIADFKQANYTTFNGTYYVQNVATGKFMTAGHDYGTRGIVDGTGLDLTLAANEDKTVVFDTQVFNGDDKHFLGSNLYMDSPTFGWIIEKAGEDVYTISNGTQFIAIDANDNLVLQNEAANWKFVTKEDRIAALSAATEENGMDATFLIQGANFSRGDGRVAASWSVSDDCTNKTLSGGAQTNMCAESYCSTFTIQQTIIGAPAGVYQLTAQGFYRQEAYEGEAPAAPQFSANGVEQNVPILSGSEDSMDKASQSFTNGLYTIEPIKFIVGADGKVVISISATTNTQWVIWDNFRLTYLGVAPTTYNVTFTDGLTDWTADPTSAAEGETIKLNYTGKKKVKSITITKKEEAAAPKALSAAAVGDVVGSDGLAYADIANLPEGVTAVAKVGYVNGSNGLALAMADEANKLIWSEAIETCAAHTPAINGATWKLASKTEWSNMIEAGVFGDTDLNLKKGNWDTYWSSEEKNAEQVWGYCYDPGDWSTSFKDATFMYTRACLAW